MENLGTCQAFKRWHWQKIEKTMRVFVICMCFFSFGLSAETLAQSEKVRLNVKDATLETVFNEIQRQTNLAFLFNHELVADLGTLSLNVNNVSVEEVLNDLFEGTGLTWSLTGNLIVVKEQQEALPQQQVQLMTITGTVKDAKGMSLPGVAVIVKGTTIGTATDINGKYSLSLPAADYTLVFSMMGMKSHEEVVGDRTVINVTLQEDIKQIDEVVVTGYQTISKERATGAYAIVDTKVLEQKPTANLSEALNGLVPGLVTQSSSVGEDARFIIRGKGTLQEDGEDTDPLIVVDGFAISGYAEGADPFSTINPNDVESVTVLKDAAATSIYGARAANGVIVITTKKGKGDNKLDISADAFWAVSSRADLDYYFNMASAESQFRLLELMNSYVPFSSSNDPWTNPSYRVQYMSKAYQLLFERDIKHSIDEATYQAEKARLIETANKGLLYDDLNEYIFRHQFSSQYNVALRGGTDRMNYAFSASYNNEKSYVQNDNSRKVLLNMSASNKLTKNLTFDVSLNSMFTKEENNGADLYDLTSSLSPWSRLVDDEGNFIHVPTMETVYEPVLDSLYNGNTPADWHYNPAEDMQYTNNYDKTVYFRAQGGLNYSTTWGLNVSAKGQYEWRRYATHQEYEPESFYVRDRYNRYSTLNPATEMYESYFPQGGIFTDGGHVYEAYNLRGQVDYSWTKDVHALTVLAGTEILTSTTETTPSITRYGYNEYTNAVDATIDYETQSFTNIFGETVTNPFTTLGTLSTYEDRYFSVYANAAYTYDDRYSVTGSFRTDASNYQSESQRDKFSPFWSVGASWLLSNERFLENADWLNQLKLRASFGIAGVAAGKRATSSVTTVSTIPSTTLFPGSNSISAHGNETLTWEKSRTFNLGVDFAMFGNKFSGSVEFYNRFSYDVLSNATVPAISNGEATAMFNNAEVLNRGVEFSLSSDLPVAGDLRWQGVLNYAYNYNEVEKFLVTAPLNVMMPGYMEGYPMDAIIALKFAGYTPEGYVQLQGKDGTLEPIMDAESAHSSGTISRDLDEDNWYYYIGQRTPKSNLSFSNYFTYKGLTLSFMITGQFGYYVSANDYFDLMQLNAASFSSQLDKSFAVYDEGYASQNGYVAYPLYNDENWEVLNLVQSALYWSNQSGSHNYIKGDHIRLNEIYLGYDLPQSVLAKQGVFSRINVYAQASNLGLIWSANGEMDPDYPVGNIKPMPTFTFGLKLGFKNW